MALAGFPASVPGNGRPLLAAALTRPRFSRSLPGVPVDRAERQDHRRRLPVVGWCPSGEGPAPTGRDSVLFPLRRPCLSSSRASPASLFSILSLLLSVPSLQPFHFPFPRVPNPGSPAFPLWGPSWSFPGPMSLSPRASPDHLQLPSSTRTGTLGSPTATSSPERTAWSWCGTTRGSGVTSPAIITCPTPARWG